jgi:hypothetical protein
VPTHCRKRKRHLGLEDDHLQRSRDTQPENDGQPLQWTGMTDDEPFQIDRLMKPVAVGVSRRYLQEDTAHAAHDEVTGKVEGQVGQQSHHQDGNEGPRPGRQVNVADRARHPE